MKPPKSDNDLYPINFIHSDLGNEVKEPNDYQGLFARNLEYLIKYITRT